MTAVALLACAASGVAAAAGTWLVIRPRRRLAGRVRPYAVGPLIALGHRVDERTVRAAAGDGRDRDGAVGSRALREAVQALLLRRPPDEDLRLRLRRSGRYDVPDSLLVAEHRTRQLLTGLGGGTAAALAGAAVGLPGAAVIAVVLLGAAAGAARPPAAVDRAITARRVVLRGELPAMAQLLALRMRAGGSVVGAIATTASRCDGLLADDLADALAQHRAGRPLEEALDAAATLTPEPEVARLHRILASAVRYGLDAAPELLRLARDGRARRLVRLRGEATRRRAALLLPTIGLLAPQMLLFIAAPLPSLIRGGT